MKMKDQLIEKLNELIEQQKQFIHALKEGIELRDTIIDAQKLLIEKKSSFMKAYPRWLNNLIFFMAGIGFYGVLIHYLL